ncbi:hypothetical protein SELMODRAFT_402994 [Selaginella moellendorffii]|uniref:Cupin type-1 domain-containing protein n=1 Tax=Selaginella moellendorffii TaxID=88036 RepID=D8QNQ3_SELML|nr:hypothetical protein SELMODRAFT_402994 [Selaginella moellendorffii]
MESKKLMLVVMILGAAAANVFVSAADPDPLRDFEGSGALSNFVLRDVFKNGVVSNGPGGVRAAINTTLFPGITSQGITYVHFNMVPCGVNLPHTHPRASELLTMISGGPLQVGFVDTADKWWCSLDDPGQVRCNCAQRRAGRDPEAQGQYAAIYAPARVGPARRSLPIPIHCEISQGRELLAISCYEMLMGMFAIDPAAINTTIFPGITSQGVHIHMVPWGVNVPHTHPRASELLTMVSRGPLQVGFVDTGGRKYVQSLDLDLTSGCALLMIPDTSTATALNVELDMIRELKRPICCHIHPSLSWPRLIMPISTKGSTMVFLL